MALSESLFLFQLELEEFECSGQSKQHYLKSQFGDMFTIDLKQRIYSNETILSTQPSKKNLKTKIKSKALNEKFSTKNTESVNVFPIVGSTLFACNICTLMWHMKSLPLEVHLWREDTSEKIGSTCVPWNFAYLEYLHLVSIKKDTPPVALGGEYFILNEKTSICAARLKLAIKLCLVDSKIPKQFKSLSDNTLELKFPGYRTSPIGISYTCDRKYLIKDANATEDNKYHSKLTLKSDKKVSKEMPQLEQTMDIVKRPSAVDLYEEVKAIKSHLEVPNDNGTNIFPESTKRSKSFIDLNKYSLIECPPKERIYYVGYCLVQNDYASDPKLSSSHTESQPSDTSSAQSQVRPCGANCPIKRLLEASNSENPLNVPPDVADVITIKSCKDLKCLTKERQLPSSPYDSILLDLSSVKKNCCEITEEIQEVVGEMKAKIHSDTRSCECACECTFGFTRKTRYCKVCGGYEIAGEDLAKKPAHSIPHPCPIYHKLVDLKKTKGLNTSGSGSKASDKSSAKSLLRKEKASKITEEKTNADSEIEAKTSKKGKKKDDRFKFNYGYQAPHIGHEYCTEPCTGTMVNVPKTMGWLWTAENIPGMRIAQGWRPGAISKRLLRKLMRAKLQQPAELKKFKAKKKKQDATKPTLIVCKQKGEYIVEVQCTTEKGEPNQQYAPLKYKIASADNEARRQAREKIQARLIRKKIREIWNDPFHPEVCETTCLKAYKQAIGLLPYNPNKPECNCYDAEMVEEEDSESSLDLDELSNCSSEVDWELQFTPPLTSQFNPSQRLSTELKRQ